jgi:CRP-like cAMP-binding protein
MHRVPMNWAQTVGRRLLCSCPIRDRAMPESPPFGTTSNRLLSRLSREDFERLAPHLEKTDLPVRYRLEIRNRRIEHVYFLESGFASVVANGREDRSIEVGLIGREGMTGLAVLMGTDRTPYDTYIQLGGKGWRMKVDNFSRALKQSPTLHGLLLQFAHAFIVQAAYTALANARSKLEERLARWLLMAHDRANGDEIPLTHEFLALMLGVRRPGVTLALSILVRQGLIRTSRGFIFITDRRGLEKSSNGAYGVPEAEFQRLFG